MNFFTTKKTVDSVLAGFNKLIADLRQVQDEHEVEAARQRDVAADAAFAADTAEAEASRAAAAITKIQALLG